MQVPKHKPKQCAAEQHLQVQH